MINSFSLIILIYKDILISEIAVIVESAQCHQNYTKQKYI
jgi:hypothetical protein